VSGPNPQSAVLLLVGCMDVQNSRVSGNLLLHCRRGGLQWEVRADEQLKWLWVERGSQVNAGTETTAEMEGETHELLQQLKELYSV
jgi:hypothetical protein